MAKAMILKNGRLSFFCPGCEFPHEVPVTGEHKWTWNGSLDKPTLTPSLRVNFGDGRVCHNVVTDGKVAFCGDSSFHPGKTIEIGDLEPDPPARQFWGNRS